MIVKFKYFIPFRVLMFFLIISISGVFTALYLTPLIFNVTINHFDVIKDFIKMFISFLYLLIGYNLMEVNGLYTFIKGYSKTALFIGVAGIVITLLNLDLFRSYLFFPGGRYDGLMADPNYYAILTAAAIPYFAVNDKTVFAKKVLLITTIFLSILVSGSKTGTIVFLLFISFLLLNKIATDRFTLKNIVFLLIIMLFLPLMLRHYTTLIELLSIRIPIVDRIAIVFNDFNSAISQEGSYRDYAFGTAIEIIKKSPLFGVGIGAYSDVAMSISGSKVIAHNTYLQLFSEWGIVTSGILFLYLIYIVLLIGKHNNKLHVVKIVKFMMIILLLGSLAISLNNSRLFWLIYGALLYLRDNNNPRE
jgi:O-antigen ligase